MIDLSIRYQALKNRLWWLKTMGYDSNVEQIQAMENELIQMEQIFDNASN